MDKINVSVIVPIYGVDKYIERCAVSLFEQTMKHGIEFIFVDDASPDNSTEILRKTLKRYPDREKQVSIISHKHNQGSAAARNTGLENALGEYVIYCDSDDWVDHSIYEKLYKTARNSNADLVACDYWGEYERSRICYSQTPECEIEVYKDLIISGQLHNSLCNKLIRHDIYNKLQVKFTEGVNLWEDVSVLCRLIHFVKNVSFVKEPLYHYSQQNSNSYTRKVNIKALTDIKKASGIVIDFYMNISMERFQKEIRYLKTRAYIATISRMPARSIKESFYGYSDVTKADIASINLPKYTKAIYYLIIDKHYFWGKLLQNCIYTIREFIRK